MAFRSREDTATSSFSDVGRDLLRVGGGYSPTGAGFYMVRILLSGSLSSVCMGLASAALAASFTGTAALPFLVGSCFGFVFGALGYYRNSMRQSLVMLERFPALMQLHLDANFPAEGFRAYRLEQMRAATFSRSWVLQSMLMVAQLTAQPAIDVSFSCSGPSSCGAKCSGREYTRLEKRNSYSKPGLNFHTPRSPCHCSMMARAEVMVDSELSCRTPCIRDRAFSIVAVLLEIFTRGTPR